MALRPGRLSCRILLVCAALVLLARVTLELVYLTILGDPRWLPARPAESLEPRARAGLRVLLVYRPHPKSAGLESWLVPGLRLGERALARSTPLRGDSLDLGIRTGACLDAGVPWSESARRVPTRLREHALAIWAARHWTEDEILSAWISCAHAWVQQGGCRGHRLERTVTLPEVLSIWSRISWCPPATCDCSGVRNRWKYSLEALSRDLEGFRPEDVEPHGPCLEETSGPFEP